MRGEVGQTPHVLELSQDLAVGLLQGGGILCIYHDVDAGTFPTHGVAGGNGDLAHVLHGLNLGAEFLYYRGLAASSGQIHGELGPSGRSVGSPSGAEKTAGAPYRYLVGIHTFGGRQQIFHLSRFSDVFSVLVPGASCWVMVRVVSSEWSRRLVLSRGVRATDPAKTRKAIITVAGLWAMAMRSTGRYARCRPVISFLSRWPAYPLLSNQVTATGTMVKATSRLARSAKVTVRAKGRKNSDEIPCTKPRGRKTATVVSVLAVIAADTSLVAVLAAVMGSSPSWR